MRATSSHQDRGLPASLHSSAHLGRSASLSLRLLEETAHSHREMDEALQLPQALVHLAKYRSCLVSYYGLYSPIESALAGFKDWSALGIQLPERLQTPRLVKDLRALGVDLARCAQASDEWMPTMPDFPQALGVFYALEDSTRRSRSVLRHLRVTLGDCIEGADAFFAGHGSKSAVMWSAARLAIDAYGEMHPENHEGVITAASSTFRTVRRWMLRER